MPKSRQFKYNRLIIAAYRLPFKLVKRKDSFKAVQNAGGLVSAIFALSKKMSASNSMSSKIIWIGEGDPRLADDTSTEFQLLPVNIPDKMNEKFYSGFCNKTIWPLFHYFTSISRFDSSFYEEYRNANAIYYEELKKIIQPGDFIWVHDYHLFFLPEMIRKDFPEQDIGFFLHIPFPSFEVFRIMPREWRRGIINGMLGSDLIGFHTNDYAQHFLKSVRRTLGYDIRDNYIRYEDRLIRADAFPIGIDYQKFHSATAAKAVGREKEKLLKQLSGKKLIFSVDRLDYTKGLLTRLLAYERFLEKHSEWHEKTVFNMVVVPSRDNIDRYKKIKREIDENVGRINGRFSTISWRPIIYQYKSLSFNELVALYNLSDVGLITPIRDGMNLVAKEYIACQTDDPGMLILSEMAGAAAELTESMIISPYDIEETADTVHEALKLSGNDKSSRISIMQNRISRYNVFTWAMHFFNQAGEVRMAQKKLSVTYLNKEKISEMRKMYSSSSKRIFFIDYDGTLVPLEKYPERAAINASAVKTVEFLSSDPLNRVIVISGREAAFLEKQFKNMNVTLVAEHGYLTREPGQEWTAQKRDINLGWKDKIMPLLNEYVDRLNGTFIEEKKASLAYHYRNADPDYASIRINDLKFDLADILKDEPKLQLIEGHKVVEIKSVLYDKGTAAASFLKRGEYDFIFAAGDDRTDEDMFAVMPENAVTLKIGADPSNARFNLKNQAEVYGFFSMLAE